MKSKLLLCLLVAVLLAGCGAPASGTPDGPPDGPPAPHQTIAAPDEPVQPWNLAEGRVVTSSGALANYEVERVVDGISTGSACWAVSGGGLQWLEVDLGAPSRVERIELFIGHSYKGEPVSVSGRLADGTSIPLHTFEGGTAEDGLLAFAPDRPWEGIQAVRFESPQSPVILCWREVRVIGTAAQGPPVLAQCDTAPDFIFYNGSVITMDPALPSAQAVAVKDGDILAVGSDQEVLALASECSETPRINLGGQALVPGFIDSHTHWFSWAEHICQPLGTTTYPPIEEIMRTLVSVGWTSIDDLNSGSDYHPRPATYERIVELDESGAIPLRVNGYFELANFDGGMPDDPTWYLAHEPRAQLSPHFRVIGVKLYMDGVFGDRQLWDQAALNQQVLTAHQNGWQVAIHAVGTQGIEQALQAIENALGEGSNEAYRHRIEHAVKVSDDQMARMLAKGIIASIQLLGPADWPTQPEHQQYLISPNPEWQMRWRDMVEAGLRMAGSTDAPFNDAPCDPSPLRVMYQAVTRRGYRDWEIPDWELNQRLTVEQAMRLLTMDGAYATFEEGVKGSITPGKWADLVILSGDPLALADPAGLLSIDVQATLVGGETVYCAPGAGALCP